jgi:hypothetical protein
MFCSVAGCWRIGRLDGRLGEERALEIGPVSACRVISMLCVMRPLADQLVRFDDETVYIQPDTLGRQHTAAGTTAATSQTRARRHRIDRGDGRRPPVRSIRWQAVSVTCASV